MNANLEITAQQHEDFLRRVFVTAQAELEGFLDAKLFGMKRHSYPHTTNLQTAYEQGYDAFLAKKIQEKAGQPA